MLLRALLAVTLTFAPAFSQDDLTEQYHALHAAGDAEGLAALWTEHPGAILVTIDADLEAGLATWERAPARPDEAAIAALHGRALWAAEIASRATGRPIFADYASAFVGWTPEEKQRFRQGQQAFGQARAAVGARDLEAALESARACRDLALPLGDWWGTAMGLSLEGQVLLGLDRPAEALAPLSQARLLYAQLGLEGSEYGALRAQVEALAGLERWSRARVAADHAVALARRLGDDDQLRVMLGRRREAELAQGLAEAAEATAGELAALQSDG